LASRVLGLSLRRLSDDMLALHGYPVPVAESFVDPSRFSGTCYRTSNWHALGPTRGYSRRSGGPARFTHTGQPKDMVVVTKLDRLARSTAELLRIAEVLNEKSAGIQSLDEPWADTTSPSGKMIMTVCSGIAEFERSLILARMQEGREAAMARGVAFGRPSNLQDNQKKLVLELVNTGKSISAVARTFNVHPATIYRCINEYRSL